MRIIFVCTGNTCRSPMAEALCRSAFGKNGIACKVSSGGISAFEGLKASGGAQRAMEKFGIDISEYTSHQLEKNDIKEAELVLTMTGAHKNFLKSELPSMSEKIFTIKEYSLGTSEDVKDPYGGTDEEYFECAKEISACIDGLVKRLKTEKP